MSKKAGIIAAVLVLFANFIYADISYQVIDLGGLSANSDSSASSINDSGQIVGWATDESGNSHAVLFDWTNMANNKDLGTMGGSMSEATAINNSGQIVGWSFDSMLNTKAVYFDSTGSGNNQDLNPSGINSYAVTVNNNGKAGGYSDKEDMNYHAASFNLSGGSTDLSVFGETSSTMYGLNDNGRGVGRVQDSSGVLKSVLYDCSLPGEYIELGGLGTEESSCAYSVNNKLEIVGDATGGDGFTRAVLFDSSGNKINIDLGTLGGDTGHANAINEYKQIVGWASALNDETFATLFDSTGAGNNLNLNDLIDPASGWVLKYAYDINNDGWIVGYGTNSLGEYHAYLLQPIPEPATCILLGIGILAALRKK
jgi:probable HAF family extracellular repeat protein